MEFRKAPKLRFKEFTDEWREKKLGDIAELTSSKRVYMSDYVPNGIPFYRGKEISELKRNHTPGDILYITETAYNNYKEKFGAPQKNDILITAVGTLGNALRIRNNAPFYFKDGNLIWLRKITQNPSFLEVLLENDNRKILGTSIGSSQQALTIIGLKKLKLYLPSNSEQQKIADFLTTVDEKIDKLEQKKKAFEKYKKGVMQTIFSQKIRFNKPNGSNYQDWEEKKLGEIGEIIGGGTPDTTKLEYWNGEINWLTPTEVKEKYISKSNKSITQRGLNSSSAKILPIGAIIFTSRATIGDVGISTIELATNQGFQSVIVNNQNNNLFIYYWIKFNKKLFLRKSSGSTFLEISKSEMVKVKGSFPQKEEQQKIAEFLTSLDKKIDLIINELEQTKLFKKSFLQQMFV